MEEEKRWERCEKPMDKKGDNKEKKWGKLRRQTKN